jgi:hypothetical protein
MKQSPIFVRTYRNNDHPSNFNNNNGLRVVVGFDHFLRRASSAVRREMDGRCPDKLRE